jgi:hypothetical protein
LVHLRILGVPVVEQKWDLPALHGEWKIADGVIRPTMPPPASAPPVPKKP